MSRKNPVRPKWWKNTFFWIAFALIALAAWSIVGGERVIRDPGQRPENGLTWLYFLGGFLMLLNGYLTHKQSIQHFEESSNESA
ncbi:MAG: hypothetical protein MUC92_04040 [Fimbriimonadaceae bacterium]|nr:hypothetical protein [Fimbriimonadaceae bacterium]